MTTVANPRETAIRALINAADLYLARFSSIGVADVRDGTARWKDGPVTDNAPSTVDVVKYLPEALAYMQADGQQDFVDIIKAVEPYLPWIPYDLYPPEEIGPAFARGNAFVSIIGEYGLIQSKDFELGIFLIAPNVLYRDHHHAAPELYAPMTGPHGWRFAPGDPLTWKPAHVPVWNPAWQHHATRVGPVPFFCIFGWTKDVLRPAVVIEQPDWEQIEQELPPTDI